MSELSELIIITLILFYVLSFCSLILSTELRLNMVRLWLCLGNNFVCGEGEGGLGARETLDARLYLM